MFEEKTKTYKLFITYTDRENEEYELFLSKLNASHDFQWEDCAVHDKVLPEDIIDQMEAVDVVVALSGLISLDKPLLTSMIDIAEKMKKPIVVIRPYGMENVPFNLEELASEVVGWNTPCIVDAIMDSLESV